LVQKGGVFFDSEDNLEYAAAFGCKMNPNVTFWISKEHIETQDKGYPISKHTDDEKRLLLEEQ